MEAVKNSTAHVLDMIPHTEEFDYNGDGLDNIRIEFEIFEFTFTMLSTFLKNIISSKIC